MAARLRHIEDRRTAGLGAILSELDELDRLRRLINMLTTEITVEPTPRLSVFLDWAREHLEDREACLSARAIEDRFEAERLFGDDDDHNFKPSRWCVRGGAAGRWKRPGERCPMLSALLFDAAT